MRLAMDIGSDVARAAFLDAQGEPQLVRLDDGGTGLASVGRQTMHGLEVGAAAAGSQIGNSETTVVGCSRLMGRLDALPARFLERLPYPVRELGGETLCNLLYAEVRPREIYGELARTLIAAAERQTGQRVTEVCLTVPGSAEERFRLQARMAVEAIGVRVARLVSQPAATLVAAPLPAKARLVAVVNCSGGTLEVSIAQRDVGPGGRQGTRILATMGDPTLGGDDLAWMVAAGCNDRFRATNGVDVFNVDASRMTAGGLRIAAEGLLRTLAWVPQTTMVLDHGGGFGRDLVAVIHRHEVDGWLAPACTGLTELCERALRAAGTRRNAPLRPEQVDAVVMSGAWAELPTLRERVAHLFKRPVSELILHDAPLLPLLGAARLMAETTPLVWDVTPYALGIQCYFGDRLLFSPIIPANAEIPTPAVGGAGAFVGAYQTRSRNQTEVTLDILQYRGLHDPNPSGPTPVTPDQCEPLGHWEFTGLRPKRGQHAAFTVTFMVDGDGILHLEAVETATGHRLRAQVDRQIGL